MNSRPVTIEILTALAAGDAYAYGLYRRILADGGIMTVPRDWAVYRELPKLVTAGYVEITSRETKKHYHLTLKGKKFLQFERERMLRLAHLLQGRI